MMSDMLINRDLFTTRVNSTTMSINERFTYLLKKARPAQVSVLTIRANNAAQQVASAKNRRLAMQMEKRLSAMAALKLKKKSIRQRLGIPNKPVAVSIRDRLTLPARGGKTIRGRRLRRTNRGRSLQRSQSMQSLQNATLQRTASMQSLNKNIPRRARSRSRSRARTPAARSRANSINRLQVQQRPKLQRSPSVGKGAQKRNLSRQRRFSTSGSFGQGTPSPRRGRRNSMGFKGQRGGNRSNKFGRNQIGRRVSQRGRGSFKNVNSGPRSQQGGGLRGRGRGRPGRRGGRLGRGVGGQTKVIIPSKEELDKQLEQYMANTKSHLDREIDTYMKESGANKF